MIYHQLFKLLLFSCGVALHPNALDHDCRWTEVPQLEQVQEYCESDGAQLLMLDGNLTSARGRDKFRCVRIM